MTPLRLRGASSPGLRGARENPAGLWIALCAALAASACLSWVVVGRTELERRRDAEIPLELREYVALRRNYFFGHREFSDVLTGLEVIAASVDMFQAGDASGVVAPDSGAALHPLRARFLDALDRARFIARFSIGMNEVYLMPSMYLLFEDEDPERALPLVELGMADKRTDSRLPLMGAFIAHLFLRDAKKASAHYERFADFPGMPDWPRELAHKLRTGNDPLDTDPRIRDILERTMERSFPRARRYFEQRRNEPPPAPAPAPANTPSPGAP